MKKLVGVVRKKISSNSESIVSVNYNGNIGAIGISNNKQPSIIINGEKLNLTAIDVVNTATNTTTNAQAILDSIVASSLTFEYYHVPAVTAYKDMVVMIHDGRLPAKNYFFAIDLLANKGIYAEEFVRLNFVSRWDFPLPILVGVFEDDETLTIFGSRRAYYKTNIKYGDIKRWISNGNVDIQIQVQETSVNEEIIACEYIRKDGAYIISFDKGTGEYKVNKYKSGGIVEQKRLKEWDGHTFIGEIEAKKVKGINKEYRIVKGGIDTGIYKDKYEIRGIAGKVVGAKFTGKHLIVSANNTLFVYDIDEIQAWDARADNIGTTYEASVHVLTKDGRLILHGYSYKSGQVVTAEEIQLDIEAQKLYAVRGGTIIWATDGNLYHVWVDRTTNTLKTTRIDDYSGAIDIAIFHDINLSLHANRFLPVGIFNDRLKVLNYEIQAKRRINEKPFFVVTDYYLFMLGEEGIERHKLILVGQPPYWLDIGLNEISISFDRIVFQFSPDTIVKSVSTADMPRVYSYGDGFANGGIIAEDGTLYSIGYFVWSTNIQGAGIGVDEVKELLPGRYKTIIGTKSKGIYKITTNLTKISDEIFASVNSVTISGVESGALWFNMNNRRAIYVDLTADYEAIDTARHIEPQVFVDDRKIHDTRVYTNETIYGISACGYYNRQAKNLHFWGYLCDQGKIHTDQKKNIHI